MSPDDRHQDGGDVPPVLAVRVHAALERYAPRGNALAGADEAAHEALRRLTAGEGLLAEVLAADERSRETALDLLAADALVTQAFELFADMPEELEARATAAVRRIAALATEGSPATRRASGDDA